MPISYLFLTLLMTINPFHDYDLSSHKKTTFRHKNILSLWPEIWQRPLASPTRPMRGVE